MKVFLLILTGIFIFSGCSGLSKLDKLRTAWYTSKAPVKARAELLDEYIKEASAQGYHLSPLVEAINARDYKLFMYLFNKGANINEYNYLGYTPLNIAVKRQDIALVKKLIKLGAKPALCGENPLNDACRGSVYDDTGNIRMVNLLLKYGARLGPSKTDPTTPLFYCQDINTAKRLIKAGVNVDHRDPYGKTALMNTLGMATYEPEKAKEMMKLYIKNGADVNAIYRLSKTFEPETILDMAIEYKYSSEIIKFLKANGAKKASHIKRK